MIDDWDYEYGGVLVKISQSDHNMAFLFTSEKWLAIWCRIAHFFSPNVKALGHSTNELDEDSDETCYDDDQTDSDKESSDDDDPSDISTDSFASPMSQDEFNQAMLALYKQ